MDINIFNRALEFIGDTADKELPLNILRTFLFIAQRGACTQKELERHLGLTNSTASRNVSYWTDRRFDRKPGLGFLMRVEDPHDRRFRTVTLTNKGREFYERLKGVGDGSIAQ